MDVFARNDSDETRFSSFHWKTVLQNGEAVDCLWRICSVSKREYVPATANVLALNVQSYFTQYLLSGGIECGNSRIYWVLYGVVRWSLCWRGETWVKSKTSTISIIMTWCPIKNFWTRHWVGPAKVLPIGPRAC